MLLIHSVVSAMFRSIRLLVIVYFELLPLIWCEPLYQTKFDSGTPWARHLAFAFPPNNFEAWIRSTQTKREEILPNDPAALEWIGRLKTWGAEFRNTNVELSAGCPTPLSARQTYSPSIVLEAFSLKTTRVESSWDEAIFSYLKMKYVVVLNRNYRDPLSSPFDHFMLLRMAIRFAFQDDRISLWGDHRRRNSDNLKFEVEEAGFTS